MKITILVENKKTDHFLTEHGFSLYIEANKKILFDTGASGAFLKNAQKLGINLQHLDLVVLSHGHYDHGNGLNNLRFDTLLCHPDCFVENYQKKDHLYCGMDADIHFIKTKAHVIEARKPYLISDGIVFLGEIPRRNDFESKQTHFVDKQGNDYFVPDDSALAIKTDKGLVIVTGCSHSGICNICDHAKKVTDTK
ncbi:MAG: MBL fold metallo-hydrolase, partial [Desulfobacteraceae bacterium]|nr:MBL fold metallo-hydrolase [Desulfobacteraceae bacterium]